MSEPKPMADTVRQVREQLRTTSPPPVRPNLPDEMLAEIEEGRREAVFARWVSLVPKRFQGATLEYEGLANVRADLAEWAGEPAGRNLVLFGPVGVGKTSAAFAACAELVERNTPFDWYPQARLIDLLDWRRPESSALLDRLCSVAVLFVDDLASDRLSDWAVERLYVILNDRWMEGLPTVATTNLMPDALREALGERSYSRLVGSDAVAVRLSGEDRRRKA